LILRIEKNDEFDDGSSANKKLSETHPELLFSIRKFVEESYFGIFQAFSLDIKIYAPRMKAH